MLRLERILIYVCGAMFPWQTVWIYRSALLNGVPYQYGTLGLYVGECILWVLCILTIFNIRSRITLHVFYSPTQRNRLFLLLLFLLFPLYALISVLWSLDIDVSVRHALFIIEGYLLLTAVIVSRVSVKDWLKAFLIGAIAPIILGLFQWFTQTTFASTLFGLSEHMVANPGASIIASETVGRWLRAYGSFPHPNIFGGYLVLILGFSFLFMMRIEKIYDRIGILMIHAVAVFTLGVTFSRSAWLAYFFVCIGFGIYALRRRVKILAPLFVITILMSLLCTVVYRDLFVTRAIPMSVSETRSLSEREEGVVIAWKLYLQKPVQGFGGGVFTRAWHDLTNSLPGYVYQPVHSVFLLVLVEYGYLGIVFFILSFGLLVWFGCHKSKEVSLYVISGVLPFVCISFFDHYLLTLYPGIMIFFAYFGIFFRLSTDSPQSVPKKLHFPQL